MDMSLVDLGKRLLEAARVGETDEVRALMTNGAPFTTDWLGTSPLHYAAQYGHVDTAEVLLRGGISRDARTKVDRTPLHIAAQEGHLEIVKLLLSHGAEIDARDMLRMTPLHWAVERNHYNVAQLLLKYNADVTALSKFEKNPIDVAIDNNNENLVELLTRPVAANERVKNYSNARSHQSNQPNVSAANSTVNTTTVPLYIRSEKSTPTGRTLSSSFQAVSPVIALANPPKINVTKAQPVFLRANLASLQKATAAGAFIKTSPSSDSEEGESNDTNSSTNVLATLATLAEATMPYPSISSADALKWLELNGIPMVPPDNSTIIANALEGGQTVALTEAGKLALTWAKQQQNLKNSKGSTTTVVNNENPASISKRSSTPKVITIVADQSRIPSIISSPQTPIVVLSPSVITSDSAPPLKKVKTVSVSSKEDSTELSNGNSLSSRPEDDERLQLKEELERIKKQAEQYREQLLLKEHEAEEYRKQIEKMKEP